MFGKPGIFFFALLALFTAGSTIVEGQKPKKQNSHSKKTTRTDAPVKKRTIVRIAPLTPLESEILAEINLIRIKPAEYVRILEEYRKYYQGNIYTAPGRKPFKTIEGLAAVDEAIKALKEVSPVSELKSACSTVRASRDHLADVQKSGAFSHTGSDGSLPQDRLRKYVGGQFYSGENMIGRSGTARDIVLMMLLDDGVPSRLHRKNLLNSSFRFVGISNGSSPKGLNLTIVVFSDSEQEIEPCEMNN